MSGPARKPTALKIIEGNPGHQKLNKSEPKPKPIAPARPRWLLPEARREWQRIVPELERLGLLTLVDRAALAAYCQAWARFVQADAKITEEGPVTVSLSGYRQPNPYVAIARQNTQIVRQFCGEFGLTPSSRGRMTVPGSADDAECPKCTMPVEMCGCG